MTGWFDAPNWGARDHDRYQRELDELVAAGEENREAERMRRYRQWNAEHADHADEIVITVENGAQCAECGERFYG